MSQHTKILTQIVGFRGWKVTEHRWDARGGARIEPVDGYDVPADPWLVPVVSRRFTPRYASCLAIGGTCHERKSARHWADLPCCGHPVAIEYAPWRLSCRRCGARAVELARLGGALPATNTPSSVASGPGCLFDAAGSRVDQVGPQLAHSAPCRVGRYPALGSKSAAHTAAPSRCRRKVARSLAIEPADVASVSCGMDRMAVRMSESHSDPENAPGPRRTETAPSC